MRKFPDYVISCDYFFLQVVHTEFIKVVRTEYSAFKILSKTSKKQSAAAIIALTSEKKKSKKKRQKKSVRNHGLKIRKNLEF